MLYDFLNSLHCVVQNESSDYRAILGEWSKKDYHIAFMPAINWYSGTYNLFDQKAGIDGRNMIWLIPAGQSRFVWLPTLKQKVEDYYETDEIEIDEHVHFPGIDAEEFEECILLHSNDLQDNPEHTILGANVLLFCLSLSSGRSTLLFILLDHQDTCWKRIIEEYEISLTWLVDSGRGMGDYYTCVNLYQLMTVTSHRNTLPALYFKGLYNKDKVPDGFKFLYAMLSQMDTDGHDKWRSFSAVYATGWNE